MAKMCKIYTLIALFLGLASPVFATTYYSSVGGSGSTCSTGSRCTIATGIGKLAGSDTLVLGDGTYDYQIHSVLPPSGSIGAPTVIVAEHALMAIIKPTTVAVGGFGLIDIGSRKYITFDGIIQDGGTASIGNNDGFRLHSSDHIIIQNSEIRNNTAGVGLLDCASSPNGVEITLGDSSGGHNTSDQFLNSSFHDNGYICTADGLGAGFGIYNQEANNIITGDTFTSNAAGGVQVRNGSGAGAATGAVICRNIFNSNGRFAIVLTSYSTTALVCSNVIFNTTSGEGTGIDFYQNPQDHLVANNTIYGSSHRCIYLDNSGGSSPLNNTIENNICYNNSTAITDNGMGTTCSNNLNVTLCNPTEGSTDPKFVSSGTGNFHLQAGSPAIGAAVNLCGTFCTDADGAARPAMGVWTQGAYIYTSPGFIAKFRKTLSTIGGKVGKRQPQRD